MRQNAYQVLHLSIADAINMRSADFTGVMTCTPNDTLASILAFVRDRRCHRFVIVEPEDVPARDGQPARKKGSLVGVLSLSDVLRFLVGYQNLKGMEVAGLGASRLLSHLLSRSQSDSTGWLTLLKPATRFRRAWFARRPVRDRLVRDGRLRL